MADQTRFMHNKSPKQHLKTTVATATAFALAIIAIGMFCGQDERWMLLDSYNDLQVTSDEMIALTNGSS